MAKEQELPQIGRRYLTLQQAGDYLGGRSAEAMRMACRRGRFPVFKIGTRTFLDVRDIDAACEAARVAGAVAP